MPTFASIGVTCAASCAKCAICAIPPVTPAPVSPPCRLSSRSLMPRCALPAKRGTSGPPPRLSSEIERQILPDGGHISRDPGAVIDILLEFLPLRQAFAARNIAPPQALLNAIDRMMPMLRFFRHSEGTFAHFNGMGATPADRLSTLL